MADSPLEIMLRDPLSAVTRKERQYLLGLSVFGIALVKTGLVPSKISALGIEFDRADQQFLMTITGSVIIYFLFAFVTYAASDFLAWRLAFLAAVRNARAENSKGEVMGVLRLKRAGRDDQVNQRLASRIMSALSRSVSLWRALFEFGLPIFIGLYTIFLLWTTKLPQLRT